MSAGPGRACYVYMVRCARGELYTGWTDDPQARLHAHKTGRGARYTRARAARSLAYLEAQPDKSAALRREAALKRCTRPEKEALCAAWAEAVRPRLTPAAPADAGALYAVYAACRAEAESKKELAGAADSVPQAQRCAEAAEKTGEPAAVPPMQIEHAEAAGKTEEPAAVPPAYFCARLRAARAAGPVLLARGGDGRPLGFAWARPCPALPAAAAPETEKRPCRITQAGGDVPAAAAAPETGKQPCRLAQADGNVPAADALAENWELQVCCAPWARGCGVSDALAAALLEQLRRQGARAVWAVLCGGGPAAAAFCRRYGFVCAGRCRVSAGRMAPAPSGASDAPDKAPGRTSGRMRSLWYCAMPAADGFSAKAVRTEKAEKAEKTQKAEKTAKAEKSKKTAKRAFGTDAAHKMPRSAAAASAPQTAQAASAAAVQPDALPPAWPGPALRAFLTEYEPAL